MNTHQIIHLDPATIRVHPLAKNLHTLADDDPVFLGMVDSMIERGFDPDKPLSVTADHQIVDGRHRWQAARRAGLKQVPCVQVDASQASTIILANIVTRKHFTKSALAFDCFPLLQNAFEASQARRLENLKKGPIFPKPTQLVSGKSVAEFAAQLGISDELFRQAAKVHEIFAQDEEYAAQMLPRLFARPTGGEHEYTRPVGLGAIIAGWSGRRKTKDQPRPESPVVKQLELFDESFRTLRSATKSWSRIAPPDQDRVIQQFRAVAAAMPRELRQALIEALTSID